jgi:hypothetical protein
LHCKCVPPWYGAFHPAYVQHDLRARLAANLPKAADFGVFYAGDAEFNACEFSACR